LIADLPQAVAARMYGGAAAAEVFEKQTDAVLWRKRHKPRAQFCSHPMPFILERNQRCVRFSLGCSG
jgi:hypothetical protein